MNFNLETVKRRAPKAIKDLLKKYFRVGSYPNWKVIVGQDKQQWQRALLECKGGSRILFATSIGSHRSGNITESAMATALTLRGAQVHVLLCDEVMLGCAQCQYQTTPDMEKFISKGAKGIGICRNCFFYAWRMYKDLGIKGLRYSELINEEERVIAEKISKEVPFSDIYSYKYGNYDIGEHAIAGALRFFCVGDLKDESFAEEVLRIYLKTALLTMFAIQRAIQLYKYDCVVFYHGIYVPHGILGEVIRKNNIRVVNWNTAYRQKRFIFTHDDTYHQMLQYEPVANWENIKWSESLENQIMDYLMSREAGTRDWQQFNENANPSLQDAVDELKIDFSKPTIGLLPNVVWDAQLHYKSNSFKNLIEWTIETIRYFLNRPDLQLLIRVHPAEIKRHSKSRQPLIKEINKVFSQLPSNIFIVPPESKISTYAIMQECNAVLIYGTKTGVELTARGIPVIVAGEAWVRNKGFTMDASSPREYFAILDKLPLAERMSREQIERARKFAYHFFYRRGIYLPFMKKSKDSMAFSLGIKRIDELSPGKSIGLDVICDGILKGKEFIYPAESQAEPDE